MTTPLQQLTAIVREIVNNPAIDLTPASRLDDIAGLDSMDVVSIAVEVECRFDMLFELDDIERLVTVGDLLRLIASKRAMAA
ncbi:MAG TPA: acyl carrier protein [Rhodopila sp.]|uniref:acyl carrier protein n=1 Tax=Rhodopila sp. TaxID=2480087 RepID=UPI002B571D17|nr:acyl carrier protein [Rhodopila sp.]HVY16413.1 acyl carrier protein [Rhodopila sp.]